MLQKMSRSITPFIEILDMISQTVEYALRAVVTIAQHGGSPCTAQQISEISQVPAPYLSKMMQGLVRAELVASKRGLHGGFALTKSPAELTVWEVISAIEPIKRIRECPLGIGGHAGTLCPLHRRLDDAIAMVEKTFRETHVADLLSPSGGVMPLCEKEKLLQITVNNADSREEKNAAQQPKRKKDKA